MLAKGDGAIPTGELDATAASTICLHPATFLEVTVQPAGVSQPPNSHPATKHFDFPHPYFVVPYISCASEAETKRKILNDYCRNYSTT